MQNHNLLAEISADGYRVNGFDANYYAAELLASHLNRLRSDNFNDYARDGLTSENDRQTALFCLTRFK